MLRILAVVLALAPAVVNAAGFAEARQFKDSSTGSVNLLDDVALNAAAATRTVEVWPQGRYSKIDVGVFFTYAAATTVTITCSKSYDGTNYVSYTSRAIEAGASSLAAFVDTWTTGAASANFAAEYSVAGVEKFKCVFGGAGAGASDLVDVQMTVKH